MSVPIDPNSGLPARPAVARPREGRRWETWAVCLSALALCFWMHGTWLWLDRVPDAPDWDLAKHTAVGLNFQRAFADGQWIPRLQVCGGPFADSPVFQYYGYFQGLAALPFLALGMSGLHALTLAVVLGRWGAFLAMYGAGRVLGAGRAASALGGFAYLLSPYLVSNLVGRVAIAEFHAHNFVALGVLGCALAVRGHTGWAVVTVAATMLGQALAHNIFFLYSTVAFALWGLGAGRWRVAIYLGLGGLAGVLLAAPQWVPAFVTKDEFLMRLFADVDPFSQGHLTSLYGLWGWLRPLAPDEANRRYFFTYPWWTLPVAAGLGWRAWRDPASRAAAVPLLLTIGVFLLFSAPPFDLWRGLPAAFRVVQFPYRLIAYVAAASALGVALLLPRLRWAPAAGLLAVALVSQWPVLRLPTWKPGPAMTDTELADRYALGFYQTHDRLSPPDSLRHADGWMVSENLLYAPETSRPSPGSGFWYLHLWGDNRLAKNVQLSRKDDQPVTPFPTVTLVPGPFAVAMRLNPDAPLQRLEYAPWMVPSELTPGNLDARKLALTLREAIETQEESVRLLPKANLARTRRGGYTRVFQVPTAFPVAPAPGTSRSGLASGDGWLREDNVVAPGQLLAETGSDSLRLRGRNATGEPVRLRVVPLSEVPGEVGPAEGPGIMVPPGRFDVSLPLGRRAGAVRLRYEPSFVPRETEPGSSDTRRLALQLDPETVTPPPPAGGQAEPTLPVPIPTAAPGVVPVPSPVYLQTEIGYNRYWRAFYDGRPVPTRSDVFSRLCARVERLGGTLTLRYQPPGWLWLASALGVVLGGGGHPAVGRWLGSALGPWWRRGRERMLPATRPRGWSGRRLDATALGVVTLFAALVVAVTTVAALRRPMAGAIPPLTAAAIALAGLGLFRTARAGVVGWRVSGWLAGLAAAAVLAVGWSFSGRLQLAGPSVAPDAFAYNATAHYLTQYPRGQDAGMSNADQFGAKQRDDRLGSAAQLAYLTGALRGNLIWANVVFTTLCAAAHCLAMFYLARAFTTGRAIPALAALLSTAGGWWGDALMIGNYDNLLFLAFLPALLGLTIRLSRRGAGAGLGRWASRTYAVPGAVLLAAIIYCYPEGMALEGPLLLPLFAALAWGIWRGGPAGRRRGLTLALLAGLALLLTLPDLNLFLSFLRRQMSAGLGQKPRPGEGIFPGLLQGRFFPALFALGEEGPGATFQPLNLLLPAVLSVALLLGLWRLRGRLPWLAGTAVATLALGLLIGGRQRYDYGLFKVLLCASWWIYPAMAVGLGGIAVRLTSSRWARAGLAAALLAGVAWEKWEDRAFRAVPADAYSLGSLAELRAVPALVGDQPVLVDLDGEIGEDWAVLALRDLHLVVGTGTSSYLEAARALLGRGRDGRLTPSDCRFALVSGVRERALWQGRHHALINTSEALITGVDNPYGKETGPPGSAAVRWLGTRPMTLFVRVPADGDYELRADRFLAGPARPETSVRHVRVEDAAGEHEATVDGNTRAVPLRLRAGDNIIRLRCLDVPTVPVQPNGDTREVLLALQGLFVTRAAASLIPRQPGRFPFILPAP